MSRHGTDANPTSVLEAAFRRFEASAGARPSYIRIPKSTQLPRAARSLIMRRSITILRGAPALLGIRM